VNSIVCLLAAVADRRYLSAMSQPDPVNVGDYLAAGWERHREKLFEMVRPLSDWLVDEVDPQPGQTVLELAAGPGETGFLVAEQIGPGGKLISTDLSPAMVEAARRGVQARRLANVEHRVMDAQEIDLPDASVDGVISRLGVMLTPEPADGLPMACGERPTATRG
jgi:SAM-dependent methyltransferase